MLDYSERSVNLINSDGIKVWFSPIDFVEIAVNQNLWIEIQELQNHYNNKKRKSWKFGDVWKLANIKTIVW